MSSAESEFAALYSLPKTASRLDWDNSRSFDSKDCNNCLCKKVHLTLVLDIGRLLLQTGVLRVWTVSAMCFGSAFRNSRLTIVIASCTESSYINSVCIGNWISEIDFYECSGTDHCLCVQVLIDPNEICRLQHLLVTSKVQEAWGPCRGCQGDRGPSVNQKSFEIGPAI